MMSSGWESWCVQMNEIRVIEAAGLGGRAAFLGFGPRNGLSGKERRRKFFSEFRSTHPAWGVLPKRGPCALLAAMEGDKMVARVMTGVDLEFVESTGQKQGYICLFEAENRQEAVGRLMDEVARRQRQWGSERVVGPISPNLVDFRSGVLVKGFDERPGVLSVHNPPWYDALMTQCGFVKAQDFLAYRFQVTDGLPDQYEGAAAWARERTRIAVRNCDLGQDERALLNVLNDCGEGMSLAELRMGLGAIRPYYQKPFGFMAWKEGRPCGFLLALREGKAAHLRASQFFIARPFRKGPTALLLMDALLKSARKAGILTVEASTILEENSASRAVMEGAGGINHKIYRQYRLNL